MTTILLAILLFCDVMLIIIFADVVLSWLGAAGMRFRPRMIAELIDPLYKSIEKYIPTTFGPFSFTPIIVIIFLSFVKGMVRLADPSVIVQYNSITNFF